jgi:hypothetical protein
MDVDGPSQNEDERMDFLLEDEGEGIMDVDRMHDQGEEEFGGYFLFPKGTPSLMMGLAVESLILDFLDSNREFQEVSNYEELGEPVDKGLEAPEDGEPAHVPGNGPRPTRKFKLLVGAAPETN